MKEYELGGVDGVKSPSGFVNLPIARDEAPHLSLEVSTPGAGDGPTATSDPQPPGTASTVDDGGGGGDFSFGSFGDEELDLPGV